MKMQPLDAMDRCGFELVNKIAQLYQHHICPKGYKRLAELLDEILVNRELKSNNDVSGENSEEIFLTCMVVFWTKMIGEEAKRIVEIDGIDCESSDREIFDKFLESLRDSWLPQCVVDALTFYVSSWLGEIEED